MKREGSPVAAYLQQVFTANICFSDAASKLSPRKLNKFTNILIYKNTSSFTFG